MALRQAAGLDRPHMRGPFELHVVFSEAHSRMDLDNGLKTLIDYLRRIEVIEDDDKTRMRRLVVEWGYAPEGARVRVIQLGGKP